MKMTWLYMEFVLIFIGSPNRGKLGRTAAKRCWQCSFRIDFNPLWRRSKQCHHQSSPCSLRVPLYRVEKKLETVCALQYLTQDVKVAIRQQVIQERKSSVQYSTRNKIGMLECNACANLGSPKRAHFKKGTMQKVTRFKKATILKEPILFDNLVNFH